VRRPRHLQPSPVLLQDASGQPGQHPFVANERGGPSHDLGHSGGHGPHHDQPCSLGDFDKIKSPKYYEACQLVYDSFDKFNKIITGTDSPPSCLLVKNYEADQTKKAADKDAKKKE
jgi:hypothetical protein